jgi:hypothetical protein
MGILGRIDSNGSLPIHVVRTSSPQSVSIPRLCGALPNVFLDIPLSPTARRAMVQRVLLDMWLSLITHTRRQSGNTRPYVASTTPIRRISKSRVGLCGDTTKKSAMVNMTFFGTRIPHIHTHTQRHSFGPCTTKNGGTRDIPFTTKTKTTTATF